MDVHLDDLFESTLNLLPNSRLIYAVVIILALRPWIHVVLRRSALVEKCFTSPPEATNYSLPSPYSYYFCADKNAEKKDKHAVIQDRLFCVFCLWIVKALFVRLVTNKHITADDLLSPCQV